MKVLLSINPEHADKIFDGTKGFEFRKSVYKDLSVKTIAVYVTKPVGKIVGEFDVDRIESGTPSELWTRTQSKAGIPYNFFAAYFAGRAKAFAFVIGEVRLYEEPIEPTQVISNFTPPQSYMYVDDALGRPGSAPQTGDLFDRASGFLKLAAA